MVCIMDKTLLNRAEKLLKEDPEVVKYFMRLGSLLGDSLGKEIIRKVLKE